MNILALSTEIASKVQEMAKDSTINNAELIERMINQELSHYDLLLARLQLLQAENELLKVRLELLEI